MTALATVNPFLAARCNRATAPAVTPRLERQPVPEQPVYARLPRAPLAVSR